MSIIKALLLRKRQTKEPNNCRYFACINGDCIKFNSKEKCDQWFYRKNRKNVLILPLRDDIPQYYQICNGIEFFDDFKLWYSGLKKLSSWTKIQNWVKSNLPRTYSDIPDPENFQVN